MHQDRPGVILDVLEGLEQMVDIMAVYRSNVLEPKVFEQHARDHQALDGILRLFREVEH